MTRRLRSTAAVAGYAAILLAAYGCAPTVHVKVDPITIYAKLDADVRLRLDEDVKALIQKNPDLF
ncbi:MAG TPA: YnbE family lipoprotein [Phenylobacterium sp.]|uniref:YnbE family lipoprotein n=1 Tax=Phenylobacterium sp. TaxID=1871053 RepID=UPI002C70998A|nr:YnbE family lipoprotein [Phenylobacterium sp.]HSV03753.1 YnbE family lipoprotein [Phenylobacterium sp.]